MRDGPSWAKSLVGDIRLTHQIALAVFVLLLVNYLAVVLPLWGEFREVRDERAPNGLAIQHLNNFRESLVIQTLRPLYDDDRIDCYTFETCGGVEVAEALFLTIATSQKVEAYTAALEKEQEIRSEQDKLTEEQQVTSG